MKPALNNLAVASPEILPFTSSLTRMLHALKPRLTAPPVPMQSFMEHLESRQMLSTIQHPLNPDITVEGEFHTFTASTLLKDRTFTDNNGNKVSFNLTGPGSGTLFQADTGEFLTLELDDTLEAKSSLFINVNANGHKGSGLTTIADIDINDGGLNFFNASKVNLTHHFIADGVVKSLTLGDVAGPIQSNIILGGDHSDKTFMSFGALDDVSIRTGASLTIFKAQDWQDNNDSQDFLEASSLNLLFVTGRNETKSKGHVLHAGLDGDFEADLTLTYVVPIGTAPNSPAAKPSVNVVSISGSSTGDWDLGAHKLNVTRIADDATGTWTANGGINVVLIQGTALDFHVNTKQNINMLKMGQVLNSTVDAGGTINAIAVLEWLGGSIKADKINFLTTFGRGGLKGHHDPLSGDFTADLLINNEGAKANDKAVGFIRIRGSVTGDGTFNGVSNADWIIAGGVGHIAIAGSVNHHKIDVRIKGDNDGDLGSYTVAGLITDSSVSVAGKSGHVRVLASNGFHLTVGEDLQGLFAGKLVDTSVNVAGSIGSIQIYGWDTGSLQANKIANFHSRSFHGNKFKADATGNLNDLDITVYGQDLKPGQHAVGNMHIEGRVDSSVWRVQGNVGPVFVGAFMTSVLFVGVNTNTSVLTLPTDADFDLYAGKTATLVGFTVTGKAVGKHDVSFASSRVAAGTLQNVSLRLIDPEGVAPSGFAAATRIGNYSRVTGPPGPSETIRVKNETAPDTYDSDGVYVLKIV